MGELLERDHFIYTCIIDALNRRMNTTIERSFSDPHIFEVFTIEFLMGCAERLPKGDVPYGSYVYYASFFRVKNICHTMVNNA